MFVSFLINSLAEEHFLFGQRALLVQLKGVFARFEWVFYQVQIPR